MYVESAVLTAQLPVDAKPEGTNTMQPGFEIGPHCACNPDDVLLLFAPFSGSVLTWSRSCCVA